MAKSIRLAFVGDSITAGCNSSEQMECAPFLPPYTKRFADDLRLSGREVEMRNYAIGGTGVSECHGKLAERFGDFLPDLLVIAYGMNDLRMPETKFAEAVKKVIAEARNCNPEMEFILVAGMPGNFRWKLTPAGKDNIFTIFLKRIAGNDPAIAVADVNSFWKAVSRGKWYFDMTGNGVNHPNDYGHRVYAQVMAMLFGAQDVAVHISSKNKRS